MRRRVGRKALTVALASGLLFLAGATAQAGWLFVLSSGVLALVAASLFSRHRLKDLEVSRQVARRVRVGDEVRLGLRLHNAGRRRTPPVRVDDAVEAFEPSAVLFDPVPPGQALVAELVRTALRRGVFEPAPVTLRASAPFGFLRTERRIEVGPAFTVVPRWTELRSFPILEPSSFPHDVLHERARTGAGEQYMGVREYRPGDPMRSVHWRSSARAGKLIVREFEEEVASRVVLVIGGADSGEPPDSAYEALVSAAASVGIYALSTGHPVELIRADPGGTVVVDRPERTALLDQLAAARPHDTSLVPLAGEALRRLGRRGTVVLFAPDRGEAGASLGDAVRTVQGGGARAVVVAARCSGWEPGDEEPSPRPWGRALVRTLVRGEDLRRCLEA